MMERDRQRPAPTARLAGRPLAPRDTVRLRVGACSDVGRRRTENQDYLLYRLATDEPDAHTHCSLFVTADGVGGAVGGAVASELAARTVAHALPGDGGDDPGGALRAAVEAADEAVKRRASDPALTGMATTLVAALVRDGQYWLANVGDSRAYLIREGEARQITLDHSLVAESVRAGWLTSEQAIISPYRHVITRSIGGQEPAQVDIFGPEPLQVGDRLLLCTDGLTETLSDREIARFTGHADPEEAAIALVDAANERGGPDNTSVIVVAVVE
jgi:serine/threonine protein phosphatase PrpC